jgi:hypothetical protein
MRQRSLRRLVGGSAVALLATLSFTASAGAADHRTVVMHDDCDPDSFNLAVPSDPGDPPTCVGEGETTFPDFIGQLMAEGSADGWSFSRDEFNIDSGGSIDVVNEGGEFHTFTNVAKFGGGCIQELNDVLGLTPVPECAGVPKVFEDSGLPPAEHGMPAPQRSFTVTGSRTQLYQCLIHPWMRSVVEVRNKH